MIKVSIGGKYVGRINADGYYGNNEAGVTPLFIPKKWGVNREFEGSNVSEYTFYKEGLGYYTVTAHSFDEALILAKLRGYTRKNYKNKNKR